MPSVFCFGHTIYPHRPIPGQCLVASSQIVHVSDMVVEAGKKLAPVLCEPFHLSVSDQCSLLFHPLHDDNVSSLTVDKTWGSSLGEHYIHFIANPCGLPIPITRDAAICAPLVTLVHILRYLDCPFPQEPLIVARLVAYLPLYNSMLSETPGGRLALVFCVPPVLPAPHWTGSAHTQNSPFSGLRFRFRAYTLHLVTPAYLPFRLAPSGHYTSERLTRPYSGKLLRFHGSFTVGNIARLPPSPVGGQ